jgi:hypothetical protein
MLLILKKLLPPPDHFFVFADEYPFLKVYTLRIATICSHDAYVMIFETDPASRRNTVIDVIYSSSCSRINWTKRLQFHTVIKVEDTPVYSISDVKTALWQISVDTQSQFQLIVAPYSPAKKYQEAPLPQIALDQLRVVHHVLGNWSRPDPVMMVTSRNADTMAAGTTYTCHTCLQGPDGQK